MATNTELLQAKSIAKLCYSITKDETSTRVNPPGGQNINGRILKRMIDVASDNWKTHFWASLTFITRGSFAEEEERERLLNQLALEYTTHLDWLDSVEQIYEKQGLKSRLRWTRCTRWCLKRSARPAS